MALTACTAPIDRPADPEQGFLEELPQGLAALAAPGQNLQAVRLRPEDGCYWYRYVGPVEITMLPLRTIDGQPICNRTQVAPTAGS
nr:hypothetical protein [Tranquillimonas alkanivorans]